MHLYVHVPFCARRCGYCDFAIAVRRDVPSAAFADAVLREWAGWKDRPLWGGAQTLATLYFGGGTPSRLGPDALGRIIAGIIAASFPLGWLVLREPLTTGLVAGGLLIVASVITTTLRSRSR